jgi:hypothetical protein
VNCNQSPHTNTIKPDSDLMIEVSVGLEYAIQKIMFWCLLIFDIRLIFSKFGVQSVKN